MRLLSLLLVCLCLNAQELVKRTQVVMGTYVSITLPSDKIALSSLTFERLKFINLALSSYEGEVYKLNHKKKISISKYTYEALLLSQEYYKSTDGYFNITIGSITKSLYHFGEAAESIPDIRSLEEAKIDFNGLHFTKDKAWIDNGIVIDLGGMGKGFGVDKLVEFLKSKGVKNGVVALSGDIHCFHQCEMGIQDPFSSELLVSFTMAYSSTSVSTSGNYRRYIESKDYNHLINPKTKSSQRNFASITLISTIRTNTDLDAYATAVSVMPREKTFRFLNERRDIGYLIVDVDENIYYNENFKKFTKKLYFY